MDTPNSSPLENPAVGDGGGKSPTAVPRRKSNRIKRRQKIVSDEASSSTSASSNNFCCGQKGFKINRKGIRVGPPRRASGLSVADARRTSGLSEVDALGLHLGMPIAAVIDQIFERRNAAGEKMSVDFLSGICVLAVKGSLENVFGDRFDNFVANFERSFRSTLMTLRLVNDSSKDIEQTQRYRFRAASCSTSSDPSPLDRVEDPQSTSDEQEERDKHLHNSFHLENTHSPLDRLEDSSSLLSGIADSLLDRQLTLHDQRTEQQLTCSSTISSTSDMLSTLEKSVLEQKRSNDLKSFEIGLTMKKLQLKERQLSLNSDANVLERWKLSMGISKHSFKSEKFKTQLQDTRQVELLKHCLDLLITGLVIMLLSLAYGTYVYSHQKLIEITQACSPYTESKSWWMPKSMSNFNNGLQLLKCQLQVLSRMLFGVLMIGAITFLLIQRSATSHHSMPITFILLLLGVACGYAGKFCVDTLGGSGYHWLVYWEIFCSIHFFAGAFQSVVFYVLYGPVIVVERAKAEPVVVPYWVRRLCFYATLVIVPLLCGSMPFATPLEWFGHFTSQLEIDD